MSKYKVASPEEIRDRISEAEEARVGRRIEAIVSEYIAPAMQEGLHEVTIDINKDHRMKYLVERLGEEEVMYRFGDAGYEVTISEHGVLPSRHVVREVTLEW